MLPLSSHRARFQSSIFASEPALFTSTSDLIHLSAADDYTPNPVFIHFCNSLINDVIFLIDEVQLKVVTARDIHQNLKKASSSLAQRQEADKLQSTCKAIRTASVLAGHAIELLCITAQDPVAIAVLLR